MIVDKQTIDNEDLSYVKWCDMDWMVAVQNVALSDNQEIRRESCTRIFVDIGPEELGLDEDSWAKTFMAYEWNGDETLEQAKEIFGGQK